MNEALHLLTNRTGPFCSPAFPVWDGGWTPVTCSSEVEQLRGSLLLNRKDTDYYLAWCLRILDLHPDMLQLLNQRESTYLLNEVPVSVYTSSNGTLKSVGGLPPTVNVRASTWPPPEKTTIAISGQLLSIQRSAYNAQTSYRRSGSAVYPDWPEDCGIAGRIEWTDTNLPFVLYHQPHVPPAVVQQFMAGSPAMLKLLLRYDLQPSFDETLDASRAVAMGLVALGRATADGL